MNQQLSMRRLDALKGHEECLLFYYEHNEYTLLGLELNAYCGLCTYLLNISQSMVDESVKMKFRDTIKKEVALVWKKYYKKCNYSLLRRIYYFLKYYSVVSRRKGHE